MESAAFGAHISLGECGRPARRLCNSRGSPSLHLDGMEVVSFQISRVDPGKSPDLTLPPKRGIFASSTKVELES